MWTKFWEVVYPYLDDFQYLLHFGVIYGTARSYNVYIIESQGKKRKPLSNFFPALLSTSLLGLAYHIVGLKFPMLFKVIPMSVKIFIDILVGYAAHEIVKKVTASSIAELGVNVLASYTKAAIIARGLKVDEKGRVIPPSVKEVLDDDKRVDKKYKKEEGEATYETINGRQTAPEITPESKPMAGEVSSEEEKGFRRSKER